MLSAPKLFVLDTNVILHDSNCLRAFADNDVAIPITVLEELDRFKRGGDDIHFHARQFLRALDEISGDVVSDLGVELGPGLGRARVVVRREFDDQLRDAFIERTADHRILNTTLYLAKLEADRPVILVTKDTNLRMKARSLGLIAQDYEADKVRSLHELYTGKRVVEGMPGDLITEFYRDEGRIESSRLGGIEDPVANENFVIRNGSKSVLAVYRQQDESFERVQKLRAFGVRPRNAEQSFALRALTDDEVQLVTLLGTAGTGKTLLALAAALECHERYRQILLARPIVPLSNRDVGFLPGDIDAKIAPYMQPLYDNLAVIRSHFAPGERGARQLADLEQSGKLVITPLPYIRGRSLQRSYFIVDEAQNLTPHEIKTIVTRAGEGTKVVLTGDIHQIDQPYLDSRSNGLSYVVHRMMGQHLYGHVMLEKGERSKLAEIAGDLL